MKRYRATVAIQNGAELVGVGEELELAARDAKEFLAAGFVEPLGKIEAVDLVDPEPAPAAKRKPAARTRKAKKKPDDAAPLRDD